MATYEYPLDSAGTKRVKIFQADSGGPVTVLLNGSAIGVISRREEFLTSRSFTLSDGSLVTVQLVNNEFQVKYEEHSPYRSAEGNAQRAASMTPIAVTPGIATPLKLTQQSTGWIVAGIGALLALLSFFSMPYIAYGYFTATAQQLASAGGQYGSQFNNLQLLWLEPLIAVVLLGIAGVELYKSMGPAHDTMGGIAGMIGISGITLLFILGKLLIFDIQGTTSSNYFGGTVTSPALASFYGAGFWAFIVGVAVALVGGIIVGRTR
nr:hypothetical protein [Ktedonobacteraceae bacterium]